MDSIRVKIALVFGLIVVAFCLAWTGTVAFSALPLSFSDPYQALIHPQTEIIAGTLIMEVRLPRVIETFLIGAAFAIAGVLMQTLTRNPLASPGLFGVNAGASLGVAVAATLWRDETLISQPIAAICGGATAWSIVMLLGKSWRFGSERKQLILAGIAVSALCSAMTKAILILVEDQAASVMTWLAGSFASVSWQHVFWSGPPLLVVFLMIYGLAPQLNVLLLGDERARSLGVNLGWIRGIGGIAVLVIVGVSVSCVGSIAFIGLIVPHMARALFGHDHRWLLIGAALLGAVLTMSADILSRWVVFPTETPAGAVLALLGAPCFIYLVRKKQ